MNDKHFPDSKNIPKKGPESVDDYLKRGGKIEQLEYGVKRPDMAHKGSHIKDIPQKKRADICIPPRSNQPLPRD